jgi:hypothetical protein
MPVKKRNLKKKIKCPLGLWRVFIDDPLPEGHPEYNRFQEFLRPGDWDKHREEVLAYWTQKQTKPGEKKAIFLQKEELLTDNEIKLLKINNR